MENERIYKIVINGVEESAKAVDELVKKLGQLEEKINNLSAATVNVKVDAEIKADTSSSGGARRSNVEDLSAEERIYEQILNVEKKLEEARDDEYDDLLQKKQILKETRKERQAEAAEARLAEDNYSKTLDGMRQKLSDLKRVIGNYSIELDGQEKFDELVAKTKQLNDEIKAAEKSYGTFGRNVGNYAEGVAEGIESAQRNMTSFKVVVNGVTREYGSAKEASRDLNNELKSMAVNGQQGTEEFKNLRQTLLQLESAMNDAKMSSQWMDNLFDTMQSFTALGSVTQGFSSLFGLDNSAINEQIQKLVSLQSVLQGIEKIQQQMQTKEGIGALLSKGNEKIDSLVSKLFGVKKANQEVATATSAATNSLRGEATAANAATVANNALTVSSRAATIATKALSVSLKAIGIGFVLEGVSLLIQGVEELVGWIKDWAKGNDELINSERMVQNAIDATTERLEERIDKANKAASAGLITETQKQVETEDAYAKAIKETVDVLKERAKGLAANESEDFGKSFLRGIEMSKKGLNDFTQSEKDALDRYNLFKDALDKGKSLWKEYGYTVDDVKENMVRLQRGAIGQIIRRFSELSGNIDKDRTKLIELSNILKNNSLWKGALSNAEEIIDDEGVKQRLEVLQSYLKRFQQSISEEDQKFWEIANKTREQLSGRQLTEAQKDLEYLEGVYKREKEEYQEHMNEMSHLEQLAKEQELRSRETAIAQQKKLVEKEGKELRDKRKKEGEKTLNETRSIYNNLSSLEIRLMNDGLRKKIAQLELNRRREIETLKGTAKQVAEQTKLINQYYDNEVFNAKKEHFDNLVELQRRYNDEITQLQRENLENAAENEITKNEIERNKAVRGLTTVPTHETTNAAGTATGFSIYNSELEETIKANRKLVNDLHEQIVSVVEDDERLLDDIYRFGKEEKKIIESSISIEEINRRFKERYDARFEYYKKVNELDKENAQNEYNTEKDKLDKIYELEEEQRKKEGKLRIGSNDDFGMFGDEEGVDVASVSNKFSSYDVRKKAYEDSLKEYKKLRAEGKATQEELDARAAELNETNQSLKGELKELEAAYEQYYQIQEAMLAENVNKYEQGLISKKEMLEAEEMFVSRVGGKLAEDYKKGNIDFEKFANTRNSLSQEYYLKGENLYHKYINDIKKLDEDYKKKQKEQEEANYETRLQELDNYYSELQNRISNQPVLNSFGIVNLSATRKNYKELLKGFDEVKNNIINAKKEIERQFAEGLIDRETYDRIVAQLDSLGNSANDAAKTVKKQSIDLVSDFVSSINYWLNEVSQAFSQVMSEWYNYQNFLLEDEANMIDKQNEILDKKLQEQEDIIDKHKNNIDSIEDELQTARGDRRDHLIDQLNAEIAAQREAFAEKKRIQKEQEANEDRLRDIEYQRSLLQWQQSLNQAIISNSLAFMNALATSPFVPNGLAMSALAAAAGGVQIALIKKQKPKKKYESGGVIEGKSHKDGGVKVLNGRAEVEGGEFITNKVSTMRNIELLTFINSKKKKVDLNDLIEFYNDNSSRKKVNLTGKFADGGTLPTIDISPNNNTIVVRDDSTYQVQVVDIIKKTEDVKRIQVMAGLN